MLVVHVFRDICGDTIYVCDWSSSRETGILDRRGTFNKICLKPFDYDMATPYASTT